MMASGPDSPRHTSPFDETLAALGVPGDESPPPSSGQARVQLIEGTGPEWSLETRNLLRDRLRSATIVMFGGFLCMFLWRLFLGPIPMELGSLPTISHLVTLALLAGCLVKVCGRCQPGMTTLRTIEVVGFGSSAVCFAIIQGWQITHPAARMLPVSAALSAWVILIYTYAIFIPNTWRRAAVVLSVFAMAPLFVEWLAPLSAGNLQAPIALDGAALIFLTTSTSAAAASYGVYIIGSLRTEAFQGRRLGQYHLKKKLGSGGMGEVYLAEHQLLKRPCAVKVIRTGSDRDPKSLIRFEREVRATAGLSHWHTVEIYDFGRTADGVFFYVMEYLPGLSLADLVARFGPLPPERAIHFLAQTCEALAEAHDRGLIHRDIKPANLFAARRGGIDDVTKLLDFGLAKCLVKEANHGVTLEGTLTGSPLYMSPEQAAGDPHTGPPSDIYSLGAVGFFLLTGRPPFDETNAMRVIAAHLRDDPPSVSRFRPDVPADLEGIIRTCLEKKPEARYADVRRLREALVSCEAAGRWTDDRARAWWSESLQLAQEPPMAAASAQP
jgi:serine/threonine-protein kinase